MDDNVLWVLEKKIEKTIKNLEKNNMEGFYVKSKKEALQKVEELLMENSIVAVGGSVSLFECGIVDFLRKGNYQFLDRYKEGLTPEEIKYIFRQSLLSDTYLCSTNALTENGELYNVDGNGNRVAAMIYGPEQVIVIAGINKIVKDLKEAEERVRNYSSPINAKRLNRDCPCTTLAYCVNCESKERICNQYVTIKKQPKNGRIKVVIVGESIGY